MKEIEGTLPMKPNRKPLGMCAYLCRRFADLRCQSHTSGLYGVSALDSLSLRTVLSAVILGSAP